MSKDNTDRSKNRITLDGITFKTSGNILFDHPKENPYHLAQSTLLEKMDVVLENGMQTLLKKIKS